MKSKLRILVDAHVFDHSYQGTASYIKGLYNALVVYPDIEITICAHRLEEVKKHFQHPAFQFIQLRSASRFRRLAIEYPRLLKQGVYDFAHFQYIVPPLKKFAYINTVHDLLFLDFKQLFSWRYRLKNFLLFYYSAKRSACVLTVSEYSRKKINHYFKIAEEHIAVTPNAAQELPPSLEATTTASPLPNGRRYILYVSRFEPRKNHLGLLQAYCAQGLYEKGYDLVLIGSKHEAIEYTAYKKVVEAIPENIRPGIHFFEGLPYETLNRFYRNAACFVFPSLAEGFGIPPIEAAMLGVKVLCSNATAMADFDFFPYQFNPQDQTEFNEKLGAILDDEHYPHEAVAQAVREKYNWKRIAEDYRTFLLSKKGFPLD